MDALLPILDKALEQLNSTHGTLRWDINNCDIPIAEAIIIIFALQHKAAVVKTRKSVIIVINLFLLI